jgi:hypothetical protein
VTPQPAPQDDRRPQRWRNAIPDWIQVSDTYQALRPGPKHTLQVMVDRADAPNQAGDLLNCYGGDKLIRACGCADTFWRHLKILETAGFVVFLRRLKGRQGYSRNLYGIPGAAGSLDHHRGSRAFQRMEHRGGGVYHPVRYDPRAQVPLFNQDTPSSENQTEPRLKIRRTSVRKSDGPPSEDQTLPSPSPSPVPNPGPARAGGSRLGDICEQDLSNIHRLLELFEQWAARSLSRPPALDDAQLLRFVSAAQHARRSGSEPRRLFCWIVQGQAWDRITQADEDAAIAQLKALHRSAKRSQPYDPRG